jgi:hypothetical protein
MGIASGRGCICAGVERLVVGLPHDGELGHAVEIGLRTEATAEGAAGLGPPD